MMPKRIHIRGAQIVTMDESLGDFASADILIEDGVIRAVGPSLDTADAERIDGAGMIALPGIIDAHTCLWQTVLRGYVPDLWPGAYYSKLLPFRSRFDRGVEGDRHPPPVHLFLHAGPSGPISTTGGPPGRRPADL